VTEYLLLMHSDAAGDDEAAWEEYIQKLSQSGTFEGGSAIGGGFCMRKNGSVPPVTEHLSGYIRINAPTIEDAKSSLVGNPHFEAGGTVEIRELPRTG
jgi:hypothetical protein